MGLKAVFRSLAPMSYSNDPRERAVIGLLIGCALFAAPLVGCSAFPTWSMDPFANETADTSTKSLIGANSPGDFAGEQAFVAYTAVDGSFTVEVPSGWSRTSAGDDVLFSMGLTSVAIARRSGFYHPTLEYVRRVELPRIANATKGFGTSQVRMVDRPAGQVVVITFQADSAPNPAIGTSIRQAVERYEFTKSESGRQVVLTLSTPAGSNDVAPARTITDSFMWLR